MWEDTAPSPDETPVLVVVLNDAANLARAPTWAGTASRWRMRPDAWRPTTWRFTRPPRFRRRSAGPCAGWRRSAAMGPRRDAS